MTLWMLRRLLKFCLKKYIGPYIKGDLDLDQLDFQPCSSAGLRDVALNVDEINAKVGEYPFELKEGYVGRVSVTLLPRLNIEIDEVELRFVPRNGRKQAQPNVAPAEFRSSSQQLHSDTENFGPKGLGGHSYSPVQEGVRVVANLFERMFFGVHVTVTRASIALEEMPILRPTERNSSIPQCLLLVRTERADYNASRSIGIDSVNRQGEETSSFTSDISFQKMYVELASTRCDGSEDPASTYGKPTSIMQDDAGLSGHITIGIHTKPGSLDLPKMDADIDLKHIRVQFTIQQIQQMMRFISSYGTPNTCKVATTQHEHMNENVGLSSHDLYFSQNELDISPSKEATSSRPTMDNFQSRHFGSSLLPGTNLIVDWVHWSGGEKFAEAAFMSEEQFAASTEEFFDCLSGSGLWVWTCSALGAPSAASSLTSGSVLLSQEFAKQVTFAIKAKIAGISVILSEDASKDHYMEAVIVGVDFSLQVCQQYSKWQLLLKRIEGFEVQSQETQDTDVDHKQGNSINLEVVGSSSQPLQALVEKSVPKFPTSLYEGSHKYNGCKARKKCFLRLSEHAHLAGLQVNVRDNHMLTSGMEAKYRTHNATEISFNFQPLVFWMDASILHILLKWAGEFHLADGDDEMALPHVTGPSFPSGRKLRLNLHFSKIRFWICSPCSLGQSLMKDHLLCIDLSGPFEKVRRPMVKLRFSDSGNNHPALGSATISLQESYIYLVSPTLCVADNKSSGKAATLKFNAHKVLSMDKGLTTMEILVKRKFGGGTLLAERTWMGVTEQQRGVNGGRKTNSEFAAATATELMDENNRKIREDILRFSTTCILVTIPNVKVELLSCQHCILAENILAIVQTSFSQLRKKEQLSDKERFVNEQDRSQLSISLDVGEADIILYPNPSCSVSLEGNIQSPWEKYVINVNKLQILYVVGLGSVKGASYFWLRHGNGSLKGVLAENGGGDVLQLLTCEDNALGRGNGAGGNALATKSAGIEVSVVFWPGGSHPEDMLITVTLGGCTFMAHGGRLDWLPGLISTFSEHSHVDKVEHAIFERRFLAFTETSLVHVSTTLAPIVEEVSSANNYVLFSLDLHDVALCYEPGREATAAANLNAKNTAEQFNPVACLIAAAAVRVSSNAISNISSKDYEIWLRDVALLLADTTLRKNSIFNYTPECLHQAGYVKVAGEAVMEAVVHINGADGLGWGVECANNQLRLDTCHDTTAALGRLIAQLQQLVAPEVEHIVLDKSGNSDLGPYIADIPKEVLSNVSTEICSSNLKAINSKDAIRFEEFLEDAFMFVGDCPEHSVSNSVDVESLTCQKTEFASDDLVQVSVSLSDQYSQDCVEEVDLRMPVVQTEEKPSFIEDYYVSKKSSLLSSSPSTCFEDGGVSSQNSLTPSDDFDMLSTTDGSGGWYDGPGFKVLENHVPIVKSRTGDSKNTGPLLQSSERSPGLSLKYPRSVGRVVFKDLHFRWRLYGGSDWPVKGAVSYSYSNQCMSGRQLGVYLEVIFHGVDLQYDTFPETGGYASRLGLSIREVRIYDCSKDAPWRKILDYHRSKTQPRESSAKALKLELESLRPDPKVPLEEYRLSVGLLPLRLHLDQRHIDFLTEFFSAPPPLEQQSQVGYENLSSSYSSFETGAADGIEEVLLPFFQVFELRPFTIRVDYIPRHVDINAIRSGNYAELANLVSWKGIELELKHVKATGVHGWGTLSGIVVAEWLEDISRNQIHKLLKGLGPIRPLCAVGSGAAKLVVLPAEHYKRDRRRLLRGMRKGATAFLRSISLEAVGLAVQLAAGAHGILTHTESALGPVSLSSSLEVEVSRKVGQPGDMREGLQQACERLSRGLERTASSLISNPLKAYHRAGTSVALASALRAAPAAAVAPAAAAVDAFHRALLGVRNSLDPEHRRESEEKYSGPPPE